MAAFFLSGRRRELRASRNSRMTLAVQEFESIFSPPDVPPRAFICSRAPGKGPRAAGRACKHGAREALIVRRPAALPSRPIAPTSAPFHFVCMQIDCVTR